MVHAAILCRVSTEAQRDNTSLQAQRDTLTALCERAGWTYEVFEEIESGGAGIANRPVLAQILGRITAGEFSRLVVLVPDRLSRAGVGELEQISETLARVGAKLVTQTGELDPRNLDHVLIGDVQAVIAKNERLRIRERTIRGREARIREGGFAGHTIPFGWRRVWNPDGSSRFEIHEAEAEVVRRLFDAYGQGVNGIQALAVEFGVAWSTVRQILQSPRYIGIEAYRNTKRKRTDREAIVVPSQVWPAIITMAQWDRVQAVRALKHAAPTAKGMGKGGPAKHPLSGILLCRRCGGTLSLLRRAEGRSYYKCQGRDCPRQDNFKAEECHRLVLEALPTILAHFAEVHRDAAPMDPGGETDRLRMRLLTLDRSESELWQARIDGMAVDQWARLNNELLSERETITERLEAIRRRELAAALPAMPLWEDIQVVVNDPDTLNDWPMLRRIFAGIFAWVRMEKLGYVRHECGRGRRPVIAIKAASLLDGTAWVDNDI